MYKSKIKILLFILFAFLLTNINAQEKRAQSGLKFLSVPNGSRAVGMGEAVTSLEGNSGSMFFNPAGMARQSKMISLTVGYTEWIADIQYNYASVSYAPSNGSMGVFGLFVTSVDYGEFIHSIPDGGTGSVDLGTFSPKALSIGLGYAKALSDKFAIGGNVKYVYQDLDGNFAVERLEDGEFRKESFDVSTVAFDFGIIYKTGYESLTFGMNVRNFSQEVEYIEESFEPPLTFEIGLSMDMVDIIPGINNEDHDLLLSVDAVHPRDFDEQLNLGFEYTFLKMFSARVGYITPTDEQGINAGIGLKKDVGGVELGVDYAYTDFGIFEDLHRITINFGL